MSSTNVSEASASPGMLEDYRQWKAMGQGGVAANWAGYLSCIGAEKTIALEDTVGLHVYHTPGQHEKRWSAASASQKAAAQKSFLKEPLEQRAEPRSRAKRYVFPQREKNADVPQDPQVKEAYEKVFDQLGVTNAVTTEWKTSVLEKHGRALFLKPSVDLTSLASPTQREICHVHSTDLSGHVTLSFKDAEEVVARGWGERHRLSGTDWLHLGYTMVYVPRDVEETRVLGQIFQAGIDFMQSA